MTALANGEMQSGSKGERWRMLASQHPSAFLLAAQLVSLLLYPLMDNAQSGRVLFSTLALVIVPLAVWVVKRSPASNWIAWSLAVPAMGLSLLAILVDRPAFLAGSAILECVLYFYAAGSLISYMLQDLHVSGDELFAAAATFTLLVWGFAYAFVVCQTWYPDSFVGLVDPAKPRSWMELLYLSFSVLSATGLSDVLPMKSPARVLVMLEMFSGVGYIAMVVSRLIGLTIVRDRNRL